MNVLSHFSSYLDTFPAALAAPEPEGGGEGDLLFVRTQTERGKGREKREERSMISFDSVQWRALSLPRSLASFHTIGRPYLPL